MGDTALNSRSSLLSILYDSQTFLHNVIQYFQYSSKQQSSSSTISNVDVDILKTKGGDENRRNDQKSLTNHLHYITHVSEQTTSDLDSIMYWPIVSNERCGTWYAYPYTNAPSVHFKSTDGHVNTWNFSLKRLNLHFLSTIYSNNPSGGVLIVDSSKYKVMPDSFSRTLPIWCAIMNRLHLYYRTEKGMSHDDANNAGISDDTQEQENKDSTWDTKLYTPSCCVSENEHEQIENILTDRLQSAIESGVILDKSSLIKIMNRPLRCFWIINTGEFDNDDISHIGENDHLISHDNIPNNDDNLHDFKYKHVFNQIQEAHKRYACIVCLSVSCSKKSKKSIKSPNSHRNSRRKCYKKIKLNSNELTEFEYNPGAGDDHEMGLFHGLTPELFWMNINEILFNANDEDKTISMIKSIVHHTQGLDEEWHQRGDDSNLNDKRYIYDLGIDQSSKSLSFTLPSSIEIPDDTSNIYAIEKNSGIYIGTRRAGRPPDCWNRFDYIINVTTMEYDEMLIKEESKSPNIPNGKYYLQMPVKEGKKDKLELEKWMSVAIFFIAIHVLGSNNRDEIDGRDRKLLIHCAQGKDRSVAVTIAMICLFFDITSDGELKKHSWTKLMNKQSFISFLHTNQSLVSIDPSDDKIYKASGLDQKCVQLLLEQGGRNILFNWFHSLILEFDNTHEGTIQKSFATKESIRKSLMFIQKYHSKASPTRNTMQKLNRFFMSGEYES